VTASARELHAGVTAASYYRIVSSLILVVEDEADIAQTILYNLEKNGFQVRYAATGAEALAALEKPPYPELVLLDLMLPDMSGNEVCRQIRSMPSVADIGVMMLTAKSDEIDRVVGFEVGADDYVTKPFSVRELVLRIQALLRRSTAADAGSEELVGGPIRIDRVAHKAWVGDQQVKLTPIEFKLLSLLLERKGRVQSREQLLAAVWGVRADTVTRTVDTHVKRLREKLGGAGAMVQTLRGVGYRFSESESEDD
jgi:two-component system phosphate regulon response regulator PhoB